MTRRRLFLGGASLLLLAAGDARARTVASPVEPDPTAPTGPAPFDRDWLVAEAQRLSRLEFAIEEIRLPEALSRLGFDQYRQIRPLGEAAIWGGTGLNFTVDLFPPGFLYRLPVDVSTVADGAAEAVAFSSARFSYGPDLVPPESDAGLAYSGFGVRYAINQPEVLDEFLAFQGASYFRAIGRGQAYGLSARGLSVRTGEAEGEEFPLFSRFWLERPQPDARRLVIHALLDSPSIVGAYSFVVEPGEETVIDVQATLFPRVELDAVGIAPMTSMFYFNATDRRRVDDYREAVHDSNGLQIVTGNGERIWRPLANPRQLQISAFQAQMPKGFGLVQRHRRFEDYGDLAARYELRPSLWVEPIGNWPPGTVQLVEIPTSRETNDNIAAFWRPDRALESGKPVEIAYRLRWCARPPDLQPLARVRRTRSGALGDGGQRLFLIDFDTLSKVPDGIEVALSASAGQIRNVTGLMLEPSAIYRVTFEYLPDGAELAEFRLALNAQGKPWSETWLYRWTK